MTKLNKSPIKKANNSSLKEYVLSGLIVLIILAVPLAIVTSNQKTSKNKKAQAAGTPSFSDEFNDPAGTKPSSKWTYNTGKWPNELETYTTNAQNAQMDGMGNLVITAIPDGNGGYTSARIHTGESFSQAYGRIEARMKLPPGKGLLPAFWMLGANFNTVPWPDCGEIDIMEQPGDGIIHMTLHGHGDTSGVGLTGTYSNIDITQWHVYGIDWTPFSVTWTIDGNPVKTITKEQAGSMWSFDNPEFIVLNLAVGGWAGTPPSTTQFPAKMYVDYVRAYPMTTSTSTSTIVPTAARALTPLPTSTPSDTILPTVSINSPLNNTQLSRGQVATITASASDNVSVQRVEFYVNNVLRCADATNAYSCTWYVPNKKGVIYTLKAIAYDASGNKSTPTQITVYVK